MKLSEFNPKNTQEVITLFTDVFSDSETVEEGKLIGDLVGNMIATTESNDLFGFVAIAEDSIVGCIFFSRLTLPEDKVAFILSPVAIATKHQGKGLGQELINHGIAHLKSLNVDLLFTYGDPGFYSKLGFKHIGEDVIQAPLKLSHPEGWLAQSITDTPIVTMNGSSYCINALNDPRYW